MDTSEVKEGEDHNENNEIVDSKSGKKVKKKKIKKKKKVHKEFHTFLNQEEPKSGEQWKDDLFPPSDSSLLGDTNHYDDLFEAGQKHIDPSEIEWKRASEIFPEPYLFEEDINIDRDITGKVGNVYFLSAIAALCEYPGMITKIFLTKEYNPDGFYKLLLFIDGEYKIVYVDDYFPCLKGTDIPYFAKPNTFQIWLLLLEKAWAKVNGGYANSISGWPNDVFRCLTGYTCEELNHDEENEEKIWNVVNNVYKNHGAICVTSRNNEEVTNIGLIPNHTYIVTDVEEIKNDKNRKVHLYKLRNPLGETNWEGAWCPKSIFWDDTIRKQIDKEKLELREGELFINVEDFVKYFNRTDCCHLMYDSFLHKIELNDSELNVPHCFIFFLHEEGKVSISLTEKNWRFNRELRNKSHPTSLIIANYEPGLKIIKKCYGSFECYNYTEKCRTLESGFYLVWCYKNLTEAEEPLPEGMKIRVLSEPKINIRNLEPDADFQIIQQIIKHGIKFLKGDEIKALEIFDNINQDFRRSGLGYRLLINPMNDMFVKVEYGIKKTSGYSILPTYQEKDEQVYKYNIGPENFGIIIGMKNKKYGEFIFALQSNEEQFKCKEKDTSKGIERPKFETFCLGDIINDEAITTKEAQSPSFDDIMNKKENYPNIDHEFIFAQKYKDLTPLLEEVLIELDPKNTKRKLGWIKLDKPNGIYLGEAEYATPHGRGCFIFKEEDIIWIGYFEEGAKGFYGKLFDKSGNLIYEGEYKNGMKNGKGIYYYKDGKKYDGDFVDDKREGEGTFFWEDGTKWEGNFKDDEMDGEGKYYEGEDCFPVSYEKGKLLD